MKKFTKISLMIAGIMGAVGCLLCLICLIGGGGRTLIVYANEDYALSRLEDKRETLTRKLLRLTGHLGNEDPDDLSEDWDEEDLKEPYSSTEHESGKNVSASGRLCVNGSDVDRNATEQHIDTGEVKSLQLLLGAGTFTVSEKEAGDGETIDLYIQGEGNCDFYVKKGTLYVEGFKGIHALGSNFDGNNIILKVPTGMRFEEVEAEVGAGIMEFYDVEAGELGANVGAGVLNLYRSEVRNLSVEIGAGELYTQDMTAQEADLTVGLGTSSYQGSISQELDAECDMGNMDFLLKGKESDYNYEIECSGGNIEMDSFETAAFAMEKRIDNGAATTFELTCSMGNITLHFEE